MINSLTDTYRHKGLRKNLIEKIRSREVADENVLEAMLKVPRHFYFDGAFLEKAYIDNAFPIGAGQTISQPSTVAIQTTLLQLKPGEKVLEIGTGSGYQSAVLCQLDVKVFTIERQKLLFQKSKKLLAKLGCKAKVFYGDGFKGLPQYAPFDKILITCGAPFVPEDLVKQLKAGGRMVIPVGSGSIQDMVVVEKSEDGEVKKSSHGKFSFVPMLDDKAN
jgi:protein-L-isoaspartate(D-aspartate) O-methyltransferase